LRDEPGSDVVRDTVERGALISAVKCMPFQLYHVRRLIVFAGAVLAVGYSAGTGSTPAQAQSKLLRGQNSPSHGSSRVGQTQRFVTTCTDPRGWQHLRSIDFSLARSYSARKGFTGTVFWGEVTFDSRLLLSYNPRTRVFLQQPLSKRGALSSPDATLAASFHGLGPKSPTATITWHVTFKAPTAGPHYIQYLRIMDDRGTLQNWTPVGSWAISR
jgi:hypothetical protein